MRVQINQIVDGIVSFAETEIIPSMGEDRAGQFLVSVGVNALRANPKLLEGFLHKGIVKTLLDASDDGTYELDGLFRAVTDSLDKYGAYPIVIPAIPLIAPAERTLRFNSSDVEKLKRQIERSA